MYARSKVTNMHAGQWLSPVATRAWAVASGDEGLGCRQRQLGLKSPVGQYLGFFTLSPSLSCGGFVIFFFLLKRGFVNDRISCNIGFNLVLVCEFLTCKFIL